jgi:hypothetical protein
MIRRILLLGLLLAAGCWPAAKNKKPVVLPDYSKLMKIQKETQKNFSFMPGGRLEINTGFMGNVTIEGWDKPRIRVDATVTAWGSSHDELIKNIEAIEPDYSKSETDILIGTVHPAGFMLGAIDYRIMVPRQRTDIKIHSNRGFVSLHNVNGWLEADTKFGYLSLVNLDGYVSTKTDEGDILVQLEGTRWTGLSLTAATKKGDVKLYMPVEYNTDLTVISLVGEVVIDYPIFQINEQDIALAAVQKKEGMYLNQRVREGGHPVTVQTELGTARLVKYDPNLETITPPPAAPPKQKGDSQ